MWNGNAISACSVFSAYLSFSFTVGPFNILNTIKVNCTNNNIQNKYKYISIY